MSGVARWLLLGACGLPGTVLGVWVASRHGVRWQAFAPNLAAHLVGALMLLQVSRAGPLGLRRLVAWAPPVSLLGIAATMLAPDDMGVHRWLVAGPIRLHASAALCPWLLLATRAGLARALLLLAQLVHIAQPDGAQALALCAGSLWPLLSADNERRWRGGLVAFGLVALAAIGLGRPDALPPVAHVEGVFALARSQGAGLVAACCAALLFVPFAVGRSTAGALYLLAALGATMVGAFPVPVLGAGAGPVLGWWGLLCVMMVERQVVCEERGATMRA